MLSPLHDNSSTEPNGGNRVGIVGMWMTCNYGAVLTSFALYHLVKDMGYDPSLIDHAPLLQTPRYEDSSTVFRQFVRRSGLKVTAPVRSPKELAELNDTFNSFLLGSDQVWRYGYARKSGHFYFLDFASPEKKRVAFGSSFGGSEDKAPRSYRKVSRQCLSAFDALSVREREGVDILKKNYELEGTWVLDPVFVCLTDYYWEAAKRSTHDMGNPFVLSYILDPTESKRRILHHIRKASGKQLINMVDAQFDFEAKKAELNLENTVEDLSVEDWLAYISSCDYLVTDSFHGMCFALIFRKPFLCIGNPKRGLTRFTSLLQLLGLSDRLITESADTTTLDRLLSPIDYTRTATQLTDLARQARQWLADSLAAPRSEAKVLQAQAPIRRSWWERVIKSPSRAKWMWM